MSKTSSPRRKGKPVAAATPLEREQVLSRRPFVTQADARRLLHELEVHQLELEMQNAELREANNRIESLLQTYTDLYDFAPIGYFSLSESGDILEVNLAGAALLGIERSQLLSRRLPTFIARAHRTLFDSFLKGALHNVNKQQLEVPLLKGSGAALPVRFQGAPAPMLREGRKWC